MRRSAGAIGNVPLATCRHGGSGGVYGNRPDVNLDFARLIGGISDPMPIRGKARLVLGELRVEKRQRLAGVIQRKNPDITLRFRLSHGIQQESAITRPTAGKL